MWRDNWRDEIWEQLDKPWDLIVIGGGITGAGILQEAARMGLRALLVEQRDFAWGTSSRSSKLVHGGLRYLKEGRLGLTRASVHEREQLLQEAPGLVEPLGFLWATYKGDSPGRWVMQAGLSLYDVLALRWGHRYYSSRDFQMLAPHLAARELEGGFAYGDAQTDDARLVLRLLQEAVAAGGCALNYAKAVDLLREDERVVGVRLQDVSGERSADIRAAVVINATGAWADQLRVQLGEEARIRPLRGSHLVFASWRLPVAQAVSFPHPLDSRPVFIFPWEGVTLVGTTDVDHERPLDEEPRISPWEVAYLMAAVEAYFPSLNIGLEDVRSTFAGVRPVIGTGAADPSQESRDHVVWQEQGLLTVTGGKLTTFRLIALDALREVEEVLEQLSERPIPEEDSPVLSAAGGALPGAEGLDAEARQRLWGRYGEHAPALVAAAHAGELTAIRNTPYLWAELRWAARAEGVVHLDDLLLRRVRLGLLLPRGGEAYRERLQAICREELGWDEARWQAEWERYRGLWDCCYALPAHGTVPDWRAMLHEPGEAETETGSFTFRRVAPVGALLSLALLLSYLMWRLRSGLGQRS